MPTNVETKFILFNLINFALFWLHTHNSRFYGQMQTIVRPSPVRMVARAPTLSTATRVHARVVIPAPHVRSVRNAHIEPTL